MKQIPKYVALLRAINVGGHTVKMDQLRSLFSALGFSNVETLIASGNVIFESTSRSSRTLERKIEGSLVAALGYEVLTFVRSMPELAAVANYKPFPVEELNAEGHVLYIGFMTASPDGAAKQKLMTFATNLDAFHFKDRELYWLRRGRSSVSELSGARLERVLGMPATLRNATTVRKIAAKYA